MASTTGPAPNLDRWLPDPQVRTRHQRSASAAPGDLWHSAQTVTVGDMSRLGRIVRWRIPGTPADMTLRDLFRSYPFAVLDEGEWWTVSGMCGRVWTLTPDYPRLDGAHDFCDWHEPGTVRILFAHWIEPDADGGAALVSESRVAPVDRRARMRMRALWTALGGFERLIGGEGLQAAVDRATPRQ